MPWRQRGEGDSRQWKAPSLLLGLIFSAVLVVLSCVAFGSTGDRVELDTLNPFGSVQDVELPEQLGEPPTLTHLFHTNYGPGYNAEGQLKSGRRAVVQQRMSAPSSSTLSYVGPVSAGPVGAHLDDGEGDHQGYLQQRQGSRDPFFAQPPSQPSAEQAQTAAVAGDGSSPHPSWELQARARSQYWRCLDDFYAANEYADYVMWMQQRKAWSRKQVQGQLLVQRDEEAALTDRSDAEAHYAAAYRDVQQLGGTQDWDQLQQTWDYFYTANKVLDSKQQSIDQRRAEALAQVVPPQDGAGIFVSKYVAPWQPFKECQGKSSKLSYMCFVTHGIETPVSAVGFTPESQNQHAKQLRLNSLAGKVSAARTGENAALQGNLDGLNKEQARINRARMLLYLREFGPLKEMIHPSLSNVQGAASTRTLSAKGTQKLPFYPGDFELPRITDCDDPGHCHDWANGQYIDSFASASTNWDLIGNPQSGYLHWDTMADDSWRGGYGNIPDGGPVRWTAPARTSELAQISTASQPFDWSEFNRQQAQLESRAKEAASLLMSPGLQHQSTSTLFVHADPALALQIREAEAHKARRSAVGGMGTWTETHDPSKAPQDQEGWKIPKGLPFGGDIASRPLTNQEAKKEALQRQLRKVETLMNRQWGDDKGSMESQLRASAVRRQERLSSERAALAAEKALDEVLKHSTGDTEGGVEHEMRRPVERLQRQREKKGVSEAIDYAFREHEASNSDDPSSAADRQKWESKVKDAVAQLAKLASQTVDGDGKHPDFAATFHEAGVSVATAGDVNAALKATLRGKKLVLARVGSNRDAAGKGSGDVAEEMLAKKLEDEQKNNQMLREKLKEAESEGYGKNAAERMEKEEQIIAKDVARKLAPLVIKRAARQVARAVDHKAVSLQTHVGSPRRVHLAASEGEAYTSGGQGKSAIEQVKPRVRTRYSTTFKSTQPEWKPHYFNHKFWSRLYHFFKGDEQDNNCTECVGDFMTAAHDIRLTTGAADQAPTNMIPALCQQTCKTGDPLGIQFPHGHNKDTYKTV